LNFSNFSVMWVLGLSMQVQRPSDLGEAPIMRPKGRPR